MSVENKEAQCVVRKDPLLYLTTLLEPVCIRVNYYSDSKVVCLFDVSETSTGMVVMPADYLLTVVAPAVARAVGRSSPSP